MIESKIYKFILIHEKMQKKIECWKFIKKEIGKMVVWLNWIFIEKKLYFKERALRLRMAKILLKPFIRIALMENNITPSFDHT